MTKESKNKVIPFFRGKSAANTVKIADTFKFRRGGKLKDVSIAYETWGELNTSKSNVVVIFTGLSASSHVTSSSFDSTTGWWESMVGSGKPVDSDTHFIVCINTLGSCFGSTSPVSVNAGTDQPYRLSFPELTVEDMATASNMLLSKIGIDSINILIGPSLGGMQALAYSIMYNKSVRNAIFISTATQASPYAIAIRSLQREVIRKDPDWNNGFYSFEKPPLNGVRIARKLGMTSYRSSAEWQQRFGRKKSSSEKLTQNTFGVDNTSFEYEIESYLEHHAVKFQNVFDANCYLYLSRAMDWFDVSDHGKSTQDALSKTGIEKAIVIGVTSDTLFPPYQQKEIAECLSQAGSRVDYQELDCIQGHDSFLVDIESFGKKIKNFIQEL